MTILTLGSQKELTRMPCKGNPGRVLETTSFQALNMVCLQLCALLQGQLGIVPAPLMLC